MTIYAPRGAGDQTAPSPVTVRTGDPAPQRMVPVTVHQDTEDLCAREVRFFYRCGDRSKVGGKSLL